MFTVHGWGFKEPRPRWQKTVIFFLSWFSSLFHDKIILINTADYETAQRFLSKRKLAFIYNGIGPIDFSPREEARAFFAKKIGRPISSDVILIGANAELTKNKGLAYFISAVSRLNLDTYQGLTLIIGGGEERRRLENQINYVDLWDRVFLLNFIPGASRYLKAFDIFILPSLKEGLPYTIMEAMAAGLPVVATNVGGIPDLVKHKENGLLVPPADPAALAEALKSVTENKNLRSEFSEASLKIMKTKFNLSQMVRETSLLYV